MVKRHSHHSSHPHLAQSGRGLEHKSGSIKSSSGRDLSSILPPVDRVAVESTHAASPIPDSSPPTIRSPSCIPSEPTPACPLISQPSDVERYDRVYRCDSQGTISSTEMPECDGHHPAQLINPAIPSKSDCSLSESVAFSDSELEYHASLCSMRRLQRTTISRPQLRQTSTVRKTPTNRPHYSWDSRAPPCRVVIRQPRIDLSQLVLVPFDPDSWTGPVLKHTSALKPAELAMLTMRKTTNNQGSKDVTSSVSNLSSHVTKYGSPNIRDTNLTNNWKVPASYDSDSGTSRKDSLSSGTEPYERTSHRRLLNKIFHLVKSGTQRRPVRADSSTSTQTELVVDQTSFTDYHSVPRSPASTRRRLRINAQSHSATQTDDGDQQFHVFSTVAESGSVISPHWRGCTTNVLCHKFTGVPSSSESSATYSALHCSSVPIKHAYSVANTDESPSRVQVTTTLTRFPTDCPVDSNVHRTTPLSRWSSSEPHDRQRFYAYADLSFDDFSTEVHAERVAPPTDPDASVCSEASLEPNTRMLELRFNQSSINRLFDTDASSCSTAYESVVEFMQTIEQELVPKEKSSREVYEDAEALYRYLAEIKERPIQETEDKESDEESTKISGT
ncbi:hypothetical protein P879_06210 [Paragonimus westermani]|uniref:Uncharacterized protein n=1 Tax=Paragonimus westermani TaxID=34504 RepID=A0A8T0D4N9_9TREM|nr:hypothetical protein P879_06210 [Paragonimus westermani]